MKKIAILLSIYGEARFLDGFLISLTEQICSDFDLLYRLDGDVANSAVTQISEFSQAIKIDDDNAHLGVVGSYSRMLGLCPAEYEYIMLADQDDVWCADKVEASLQALQEAEAEYGSYTPLLGHCDMQVADENLKILAPSMMKYAHLDPEKRKFKDILVQNNVSGCAAIFNQALRKLVKRIPEDAVCHDWYLALAASALGRIIYLNRALVLYRQHSDNVYGAVKYLGGKKRFSRKNLHQRLLLTQHQASGFVREFGSCLSREQYDLASVWGHLSENKCWIRRLFTVIKYRFRKGDFLRNCGMWWAI